MNAKVDHFDPIVFERPGVTLTRSQVDAFGREIDALREEIMADLGGVAGATYRILRF